MVTLSLLHNLNLNPILLFNPSIHQNHISSISLNPSIHQNPISSISLNPSIHQNPISSISLKPSQPRCSISAIVPAPAPPPPIRIPHHIKIEAQYALRDYLYITQRYAFIDADFISKKSPHFINSLILRVRINYGNDDSLLSLRRYLRYHPINEFEPFLESIGINQKELELLLPKDLFFLRDDSVLVDNFHVLFNHGVPRNKMGKIYREAREVFGYGSGVLSKKFESYENLGLTESSVVKLFVSCPLLLVGDQVDRQFILVLDWLKRFGIEIEWFVNCMCSSRTYRWKAMIDNIEFFLQGGYSEKEMYDLFKARPRLLLKSLGNKTYSVVARLIKSGLDVDKICSCFKEDHDILSSPRMRNLTSMIYFMSNIRMDQDAIAHVLYNYLHDLSKLLIKGQTTMRKELGVGKGDLCEMIQDDPLEYFYLALKPKQKKYINEFFHDPHSYLEKTSFLQKLGYIDNSEEMEVAMKVFGGKGHKLQERFDYLVEAGLEYNTVVGMVKRAPRILSNTKTLLQKKVDFLKNTLGYPIEFLVGCPGYFNNSLDRLFARFTMYEWLKKRTDMNPKVPLCTLAVTSEKRFLEIFVKAHPEGPTAWQTINSLSNQFNN